MNTPIWIEHRTRRVWAILCLAVKKFFRIGGVHWAGAFAFNTFFSLFPLIILFVTIASIFIDREQAGKEIIVFMKSYVPISGGMQSYVFDTIAGVVKARREAGAVALPILLWTAIQCFITLICATNRAWNAADYNWWQLPLKSLALLGVTTGAVVLGIAAPVLMRLVTGWLFPTSDFYSWICALGNFFVPVIVMFLSLSLFYKLAPRRPTRFAEVWVAALCATALLQAAGYLFVIYLTNFATLNLVYGAFGGIMALLLWIYLSGCIFVFGVCLCAAQHESPDPYRK